MKNYIYILFLMCLTTALYCSAQSTTQEERVYLHLNRSVCTAGETVFFKAWLLTKNNSNASQIVYVELRDLQNNIIDASRFYLTDASGNGTMTIPDTLPTGYYFVLAATDVMKNKKENCFRTALLIISKTGGQQQSIGTPDYLLSTDKSDTSTTTVCYLTTDKQSYNTRQQGEVHIELKDTDGKPVNGNLSLSITKDLGYEQENISSFIRHTLPLLENNTVSYLRENNGYILKGRVVHKQTKTPQKNIPVLLTLLDSTSDLHYSHTDSSGCFNFLLNQCYDNNYISLSMYNQSEGNDWIIELDKKFIPAEKIPYRLYATDSGMQAMIHESRKLAMYNTIFDISLFKKTSVSKTKQLYQYPALLSNYDYTVNITDYVDMSSFEELVTNVILPGVRVRKKNDNYSLHIFDKTNSTFFEQPPLVLINNIPVTDMSQVATIDTRRIEKIRVNTNHLVYGTLDFYGIIAIFTKQASDNRNNNSLVFYNRCKSDLLEFATEATGSSRLPDLRQALYWQPTINFINLGQAKETFFTSDLKGKYRITIQGITSNGHPVNASTMIEVK